MTQEQLAAEVKGIYAGLVMVENKCIDVDGLQNKATPTRLPSEQWQALIALHRTLLHEHHDFFLASQHPTASPSLQRLAAKYSMPARMWRHGIHSFLDLLRHTLPRPLDHMLAFIYLAYSMMALRYETVPAFEDTCIECLGDLSRYRMAIEDEDIRDRETWTRISRSWYTEASDNAPLMGRFYHHLAILARPDYPREDGNVDPELSFTPNLATAQCHTDRAYEPGVYEPSRSESEPRDFRLGKSRWRGRLAGSPCADLDHILDDHWPADLDHVEGHQEAAEDQALQQPIQSTQLASVCLDEAWDQYQIALRETFQGLSDLVETCHYRPLPEDYAMRGLVYAEDYYPSTWFTEHFNDDDYERLWDSEYIPWRKDGCLFHAPSFVNFLPLWTNKNESERKYDPGHPPDPPDTAIPPDKAEANFSWQVDLRLDRLEGKVVKNHENWPHIKSAMSCLQSILARLVMQPLDRIWLRKTVLVTQ